MVWETQILDFSIIFDVISKQNLKRVSDRQQIAKNVCFGGGYRLQVANTPAGRGHGEGLGEGFNFC